MESRKSEILGGCIIFVTSLGIYIYNLYLISNQKYFYPKAMSIVAAMMIVGLGLIIFPSYRRERINRGENIEELQGLKLLTTKWWGILILSILTALCNFFYFVFF